MDPMVTVMRQQRVLGWPDDAGMTARDTDTAYVLPLSKALTRAYTTDAHFTGYVTPNGRRLKTSAMGKVDVRIDVLIMDVDCDEVHGSRKPAPESWRLEIRRKLLALIAAHPGAFYFETRGGSRIVYRQPVPVVISNHADAQQWKQDYAVTCAYFARVFGIECDLACADWTRMFRLPRATRSDGKVESWPVAGNAANVSPLYFEPELDDLNRARELLPAAFDERERQDATFEPHTGAGAGLLYYALQARGYVIRPYKSGTHLIRCPNEAAHSSGKTGDTSTMLYPPSDGQRLGFIKCLHAHCAGLTWMQWLHMFSREELENARTRL